MRISENISTNPISVEKTIRGDEIRSLTSARAGRLLPIAFVPILREDSVRRGRITMQFKMDETVHPLMNAINVTAFAHFVPYTAFDRFKDLGLDAYNRAYQGIPEPQTGAVIPYHRPLAYNRSHAVWKTLGVHWVDGQNINGAVAEAYNAVFNFRCKARSKHLPLRSSTAISTLAPAFWKNTNLGHIVADFDEAMMDGEVELQFAQTLLPLRGLGRAGAGSGIQNDVEAVEARRRPGEPTFTDPVTYPHAITGSASHLRINTSVGGTPEVFAELRDAGVRISLANIELAKQTAAFAKLREQYKGLDDDHIIDLLMEGIRVPDEALKQPMLLDRKSTVFGYTERYATDGDSLDKSVTNGATELTLNFRTPPMNVQGIVIITCEIVPEQLYERQKDRALELGDPNLMYPNFMRDFLDPQKVDVVKNDYVDVLHETPNGVFGYAPLNHHWKRSITRIGGKYFRPAVDAFNEDRQRFWSIEKQNPKLTEDFYLVPVNLPHTVFADSLADPFEILTLGKVEIVGNTVFGKTLEEDENHYDAIISQVDQTRISPQS